LPRPRLQPFLGLLGPLLLVGPPLVWLGWALAAALGDPGLAGLDSVAAGLLGRSARVAAAAAALATVAGTAYGWLLARVRVPGVRLLALGAVLPLLLPAYGAALAWRQILGADGPAAALGLPAPPAYGSEALVVWVLAGAWWPVPAWLAWAAARSVARDLEEAARLHAAPGRAARWAAGPVLRAAVPAGGVTVFLLALADFGVPNSLGVATYPVELVNRYQYARQVGEIARLALPLVALALPLVWLQGRLLARTPLAAADSEAALPRLGGGGTLAGALLCAGWVAATALLPLGMLIAAAGPPATYAAVWAESAGHVANTAVTAGGGMLLAVGAAVAYGWLGRPQPGGGVEAFLCLPLALPASLVGIALIGLLNRPGPPGALYDGLGSVVLAYGVLFYPFAHRLLQPAWPRVDAELAAEGELLGAGVWARLRHGVWPVVRPYAGLAAVVTATLGAREMDATALLRPPGGDTVAFRIHDYLHFGPTPNVAALCVLVTALGLAVVGVGRWVASVER